MFRNVYLYSSVLGMHCLNCFNTDMEEMEKKCGDFSSINSQAADLMLLFRFPLKTNINIAGYYL